MPRLVPIILAIARLSLVSAIAEQAERPEYQSATIEAKPEYQAAALTELTEQKLPPPAPMLLFAPPPIPPEIPQARRDKMEAAFLILLARFEYPATAANALEFENRISEVAVSYCDKPRGEYLSATFDTEDQLLSIHISGEKLPLAGNRMITPERFTTYAADCHRRAFGFLPQGELELDRIDVGPDGLLSGSTDAVWTARPEDIPMQALATISASKNGLDTWSLSCRRGPTAVEVSDIAALIQLHPTRITEAQAIAIAWKNWQSVRDARYENGTYRIWPKLREISPTEMTAWNRIQHGFFEQQAWLPADPPSPPFDPVAYEITIADGLFQVSAIIDRHTGKLLRLNQGRMHW